MRYHLLLMRNASFCLAALPDRNPPCSMRHSTRWRVSTTTVPARLQQRSGGALQPYVRRQPHTSQPAQYRETRKTPRDQRSCWIPVAPGTPNDLSKSAEVRLSKMAFVPATYEIRTKMAKSRGLEKGGRRERIFALGWLRAVQSFVREGPCLLGIFARSQAGREYLARCDWRRESNWNPTFSVRREDRQVAAGWPIKQPRCNGGRGRVPAWAPCRPRTDRAWLKLA